MNLKRLLILSLACYRLADLIANDDGPLWVFARLREFADRKAKAEQRAYIERGKWQSFNDGINCPFCVGMWLAFILTFVPEILLYPFAIAGLQSWLESRKL